MQSGFGEVLQDSIVLACLEKVHETPREFPRAKRLIESIGLRARDDRRRERQRELANPPEALPVRMTTPFK